MPNRSRLLATLLLSFLPLAAPAAPAAFTFRYGLDEADFRSANAQLYGQKNVLVDISVAEVEGRTTIAAIWQHFEEMPAPTPEQVAQMQSRLFLHLTAEEVLKTDKRLHEEESQLETVDAYDVGGKTWYAVSYSLPKQAPVQVVGAFLDNDASASMRDEARKKGYDLLRLELAREGDGYAYFPTFVTRGESEIDAVDGNNEMDFLANRVKMQFADMASLSITMFRNDYGYPGFLGMFDKGGNRRELVLNKSAKEFREKIEPLLAKGTLVFDIDSFVADGELRYSAVMMLPDGG